MSLSELDRKIVLATQAGIEICPHPYAKIAEQLEIAEETLLQRLSHLKNTGTIRRIALVPNHYKLGFTANGMSVWKIKSSKIEEVGHLFAKLPYVSHCYERGTHDGYWEYNVFAMVHGRKQQEVEDLIKNMYELAKDNCEEYDVLYSEKILKKTGLRISKGNKNV